jgi:hypothetical protein
MRRACSVPGGGRPFEIFVAAHSSAFFSRTGSDGADVRLCDRHGNADPEHDAIIVADNLAAEPSPSGPIDWSANVLAHELFHVFQGGVMSHFPTAGAWWLEATAEWGGDDIFGAPRTRITQLDQSLFEHPDIPLDAVASNGPAYERRHPYAVWRFVQWLDDTFAAQHQSFFAYLTATFRALGAGTPSLQAVTEGFPAGIESNDEPGGAVGFDRAVADFWEFHLTPQLPEGVLGLPVTLQNSVSLSAGSVINWSFTARPLALSTLLIDTPGVNEVYVEGVIPADDAFGWIDCGNHLGPAGASFTLDPFFSPDPGTSQVRVGFMNFGSAQSTFELSMRALTPEAAPDPGC